MVHSTTRNAPYIHPSQDSILKLRQPYLTKITLVTHLKVLLDISLSMSTLTLKGLLVLALNRMDRQEIKQAYYQVNAVLLCNHPFM